MELILWRHAEAEDAGRDGDMLRRLTARGRRQAERMAGWLRPRLEGKWLVIASPATRTLETAAALQMPVEAREALQPGASPELVLREAGWPTGGNVIVVGHQPTLGETAAALFGVEGDLSLRKGAIWWFATRHRGDGETILRAVLDPEML